MKVYPSILGTDYGHLQDVVDKLATADGLHLDVMDGHLVPNLTFGAILLEHLHTDLLIDVHLMVSNPSDRFEECITHGAKRIAFHIEADGDVMENISLLRSEGISVGLAIDHDTEVEAVFPYLEHVDYVLVMTIRAGFSFQDFIPEDLDKVRAIKDRNPNLEVMIDGGVDDQTAKLAAQAGVDSLAVASYLIGKEDIRERIRFLQSR